MPTSPPRPAARTVLRLLVCTCLASSCVPSRGGAALLDESRVRLAQRRAEAARRSARPSDPDPAELARRAEDDPAPARGPAPPTSADSRAPRATAGGDVRGRVVFSSRGGAPTERSPLVVTATPSDHVARPSSGASSPTAIVVRADGAFSPGFLVVAVGQEVRFENEEPICHGFFSSSRSSSFELGTLGPGESSAVRMRRPGLAHVYCSLHSGERVTILATPTGYFDTVDEAGAFEITGLPPGPCLLETWSEDLSQRRLEVTVPVRGPTFAELRMDEPQQ